MTIVIAGTVIDFPNSSASPNWSPALIQFAEAVEQALSGIVGTYDISPRTFALDAVPNATATDVPSLAFPTSEVRGAFVQYTVYRTTDSANAAETGTLSLIYNPNMGTGLKWEMTRQCVGNGQVVFTCLDTGQVQVTLTALSGTGHSGRLNYTAKAIQQVY